MLVEFRAYGAHSPQQAIEAYMERLGYLPTGIVVRPGYELANSSELIVESRFGIASGILLTHQMTADQLRNYYAEKEMPKSEQSIQRPKADVSRAQIQLKKSRGRPKSESARCPHCQQLIRNFEALGYWYGWDTGQFPPYWDDLSAYVFERDDNLCHRCGKQHSPKHLVAHHIVPKETGGADSARNLATTCRPCHDIIHA